ncbi:MAG: mobile mystery protein A [Acidimicrobiales bacterium]
MSSAIGNAYDNTFSSGNTEPAAAARMGVTQATAAELEASEVHGTIGLGSLVRAAGALDCELVYFLVPRRPLSESVQNRARQVAATHLARIGHHSRLEDQTLSAADTADELESLAAELVDRRGLWSDPS